MDIERTQNKGAFGFSVPFQGCNFLRPVATKKVATFQGKALRFYAVQNWEADWIYFAEAGSFRFAG